MLLNEERRRRAAHYEDIDRHRFELVLPFYDPELLTLVLSEPIDDFLGHAFYHRWLAEFPPETRSAPWQTYPGHEPCALPKPPGVYTQWDPRYGRRHKAARTRALIARIERALAEPGFPDWLLRRSVLRLAGWLTRLGVEDLTYLFVAADVFVRYVKNDRPGAAVAASPPGCSSTSA
jgi:asparagine synthase (glutamine-hydrolysing)